MSEDRKSHPWWLFVTQGVVLFWLMSATIDPMDKFTSWFNDFTIYLSIAFCVLMHFIFQHYKAL